jgi:hypothetical protein
MPLQSIQQSAQNFGTSLVVNIVWPLNRRADRMRTPDALGAGKNPHPGYANGLKPDEGRLKAFLIKGIGRGLPLNGRP